MGINAKSVNDNVKVATVVAKAIDGGAKVITLDDARNAGWKNVVGCVIKDQTKLGVPIVALVHRVTTSGHVVCISSCQRTGEGFEIHTQDVWQAAYSPAVRRKVRLEARRVNKTEEVKVEGKPTKTKKKSATVKQISDEFKSKNTIVAPGKQETKKPSGKKKIIEMSDATEKSDS